MLKTKLTLAVAAFGLAALCFAAGDGYTLIRSAKVGDVHRYKLVGKFDVGGMQFDYEAISTRKVQKLDATGNYTIEEVPSDVKLNGADAPGDPAAGTATTTFTPKGEIVEIKGGEVGPDVYRFSNISLFVSPDAAVKPGDTWTYDVKEDKKTGAVAAKATYTLVGDDKLDTVDALKIKFSVKESGADGASSEGTIWLKKDNFDFLKSVSKWTNVPVPGAPVPISGDVTVTLADK